MARASAVNNPTGLTNGGLGGIQSQAPGAPGATKVKMSPVPPPLSLNDIHLPPSAPAPAPTPHKAPVNGLAAFANSDLGRTYSQLYGPSSMPNYGQAFQGAISAARGNIQQMLHGALGDIQNSQAQAQQALGHYEPMVNDAYQAGLGQIANARTAGASALAKYGVHANDADLAPERIAMDTTHNSDLQDRALLDTGIQQQAATSRAQAQLAAQDRMGQVDQLQAQLANQYAMAQMSNAHDVDMLGRQTAAKGISGLQDFLLQQKLAQNPATNTAPASGRYQSTGLTQGQLDQVHKDPRYARFSQLISGGEFADPSMISNVLASDPNLLAVLQTENPTFFTAKPKK